MKTKGRPKLKESKRKSVIIRVCATKAQAAAFVKLGGADWLRAILDTGVVK